MGIFSGAGAHRPSCPSAANCAKWAQTYLKYCLCSTRDGMALTLGLLSVISWGVAEVPQIITNYKHKSTEGLSLAFLMTWIVGDFFNLIGCFLEPETLPTQFYMALLYTITTVILTGQTVYYSHIYHRLKAKKARATSKPQRHQRADASLREKLLGPKLPSFVCLDKNLEYRFVSSIWSARSLSSSPVPMSGTWSANYHQTNSPPEIDDQKESLVSEFSPAQYAASPLIKNSLSVVPWMSLLLGMSVLHFLVGTTHQEVPNGIVIPVGRRLLLLADDHADSSVSNGSGSGIGSFLGWVMAGLNPLMFTFALVGNVTYVGSILVKSMDWSKLKPNLPWLVDAGGCVLLDTFVSFCKLFTFRANTSYLLYVLSLNPKAGIYAHPRSELICN
uniref:PQ-loop repeat family protein / transmembrane family protein n=1 Tax=Oryza rufipogon TaxID=4529 RepID=A0A0E0MUD1_ORYRU